MTATPEAVEAGIQSITERSDELVPQMAQDLDTWVNGHVPPVLDNHEYAARCSALMIALNRQLARCAASFGAVHQISDDDMLELVGKQFHRNYTICTGLVQGAGQRIQ